MLWHDDAIEAGNTLLASCRCPYLCTHKLSCWRCRERRFLGCIKLPISAVYRLGTVKGSIQLEAPPVALSYSSAAANGSHSGPAQLSVFITLQPALPPAQPTLHEEEVGDGEQADLARHATR